MIKQSIEQLCAAIRTGGGLRSGQSTPRSRSNSVDMGTEFEMIDTDQRLRELERVLAQSGFSSEGGNGHGKRGTVAVTPSSVLN